MRPFALLILAASLSLSACTERTPVENAASVTPAEHTAGQGDARLTLRVSDTQITTAGRITVELAAPNSAEDARIVEDPAFEGWTVVDHKRDALSGAWSWTLEPFLDGQYTIEAISIAFGEGDDVPIVQTPAVEVLVASVLVEGDEQLAGIKGVVDAPPADRLWLIALIAGVAAVIVGGGVGLVLMLAAKAREKYELRALAHDIALARLDRAMSIDSGGIEGTIVRVSDVLRRYIEDRYALRAPEQTTEEFLAEMRGSVRFRNEDIALLENFLTRVDLIKFAGASASTSQCEEAGEAVREFVRSTGSPGTFVVVHPDEAALLNGLTTQRVRAGYDFESNGGAP